MRPRTRRAVSAFFVQMSEAYFSNLGSDLIADQNWDANSHEPRPIELAPDLFGGGHLDIEPLAVGVAAGRPKLT